MEENKSGGLLQALLFGGGSGGGSQEPLVLTAVPGASIVNGTVIGATPVEIRDAWLSGRQIRLTLASEALTLIQSSAGDDFDLSSYFFMGSSFCKGTIHVLSMTYEIEFVLTSD